MSSKSFGSKGPQRPHIVSGGGMGREVEDLRRDVEEAFETIETPGNGGTSLLAVEEFINVATKVANYVLTSTSATTAIQTITTMAHGTLAHARNLEVGCTITGTGAGSIVVTGTDIDGEALTETFAIPAATATVVGNKAFKTITSVTIPATTVGMTALAVVVGTGDKLGLGSKVKVRNGVANIIAEMLNGALVGGASAAGNATLYRSHNFLAPAAKGTNYVAQYASGAPIADVTGPFTRFFPPRNVNVILTGGTAHPVVTVTGTDYKGATITEAFSFTTGPATIQGTKAFKTITGVSSDIDPGGTVDVKVGDALGLPCGFASIVALAQGVTLDTVAASDGTTGCVRPTTLPNGALNFTVYFTELHAHSGGSGTYALPAVGLPYGTFLPATVPNGTNDYLVIYERDLT